MRHAQHYPISKVIQSIIDASGESRSEFVRALGFRRINSALRVLDSWLIEGEGGDLFITRLQRSFADKEIIIQKALIETSRIKDGEVRRIRQEREEKLRLLHQPCLIVRTQEEKPSQLVLYALFGRDLKIVRLPKRIAEIESERAVAIVRWRIRRYVRRFNSYCPFWGPVQDFLFSRKLDHNLIFSRDGKLLSEQHGLPSLLEAALKVRVAGRTFHVPVHRPDRKLP